MLGLLWPGLCCFERCHEAVGREAEAGWSSVLRFMPVERIHRAIVCSPSVESAVRFTLDPNYMAGECLRRMQKQVMLLIFFF